MEGQEVRTMFKEKYKEVAAVEKINIFRGHDFQRCEYKIGIVYAPDRAQFS